MDFPPFRYGVNRLARWLTAVFLIFLGADSLHGLNQMYGGHAMTGLAGAMGMPWLTVVGIKQVLGILLVLAAVLLGFLVMALWRSGKLQRAHWWFGVPVLLLMGAAWSALTPALHSKGMAALTVALAMLLLMMAVALVAWTGDCGKAPRAVKEDFQRPGVFALGVFSTSLLVAHEVLGMGLEGSGFGMLPHLIAVLSTAPLVIGLAAVVLHRHFEIEELRRPAVALLWLLPVEMGLSIWCNLLHARQPGEVSMRLQEHLAAGELHLLVGGVLGALCLLLTLRARTHLTARVITSPLRRGAAEA